MQAGLWVLVGVMALCIALLFLKLVFLKRSLKEMERAFADRLVMDTNTLIDVSSGDSSIRSLANAMNLQLRKLRDQRRRYQQGDRELKNAVTNISHDLRTPLTAICGYLDLLESEEKSETAEQYLQIIRNRSQMLTLLTEELFGYSMALSDRRPLEKEPVELNRVLEESIAAFYTALHDRGIEPAITMPQKKIVRTLDPSALARVFSNLLNNAVRYSDGDLTVTLSDTGEIVFANTAFGLDQVQVGRLFDRFYTVETAGKSTGLGLAIAKALTEQMGGMMSAQYENHRLCIRIFFKA